MRGLKAFAARRVSSVRGSAAAGVNVGQRSGGKRKPRIVHGRIPTEHHAEHADGGEHCPRWSYVPHLGAGCAERHTSPCSNRPARAAAAFAKMPADLLVKDVNGFWAGFVPGMKDGDRYRFYVVGTEARASSAIPMRASSNSTGIRTATASCAIPAIIPGMTQASARRLSATSSSTSFISAFFTQRTPPARISGRIASARSSTWWTGSNTLRISA